MMHAKLKRLREGGSVTRFHTVRTIRQQTVADHSHGVALLVTVVAPHASAELLKAALWHDLSECHTGDTPATAKWTSPALRDELHKMGSGFDEAHGIRATLSIEERQILKWCDMMDLVMWCMEEVHMGNRNAFKIANNGLRWLAGVEPPTEQAKSLLREVRLEVQLHE
jgi:5'-deoxynucleotidase YfbR-like HD superfamily hydrolase